MPGSLVPSGDGEGVVPAGLVAGLQEELCTGASVQSPRDCHPSQDAVGSGASSAAPGQGEPKWPAGILGMRLLCKAPVCW